MNLNATRSSPPPTQRRFELDPPPQHRQAKRPKHAQMQEPLAPIQTPPAATGSVLRLRRRRSSTNSPLPTAEQAQKPYALLISPGHLQTEDVVKLLDELKRQQADIINRLNTTTRLIETLSGIVSVVNSDRLIVL
ncbi:hypothetical protein NMY22_g1080 [Coprinellus aureogranulatus]|nr:hypothetical protein NMY22_g1080 [Coprinellus aureogranulatus]